MRNRTGNNYRGAWPLLYESLVTFDGDSWIGVLGISARNISIKSSGELEIQTGFLFQTHSSLITGKRHILAADGIGLIVETRTLVNPLHLDMSRRLDSNGTISPVARRFRRLSLSLQSLTRVMMSRCNLLDPKDDLKPGAHNLAHGSRAWGRQYNPSVETQSFCNTSFFDSKMCPTHVIPFSFLHVSSDEMNLPFLYGIPRNSLHQNSTPPPATPACSNWSAKSSVSPTLLRSLREGVRSVL